MRFWVLSAALCVAATVSLGQSLAQEPAASGQSTRPLDRNNPNTVICKKLPPPTGSHIGPRMACYTSREWDRIEREAQQGYRDEVKKSYSLSPQ